MAACSLQNAGRIYLGVNILANYAFISEKCASLYRPTFSGAVIATKNV